jgi:predicted outer membrane repeat protein
MAILTVTSTANSGSGSLRDTIAKAQSGDVVKFASTLAGKKITLTSGNITIGKSITVDGYNAKGLSISGNQSSRIFFVEKSLNVTVKNLAFVDGRAASSDISKAEGGAIKVRDYSTLTVENSTFRANSAGRGGAIRVGYGGSLTVRNSTFDGNNGTLSKDGFSAGAIATYGAGGPTGKGKLVIENSTFVNNKGVNGGAVYNLLGPVSIKNSVFKNNQSSKQGGAIFTDGVSGSEKDDLGGKLTIEGSRFEANKAVAGGGALYLWTYKADQAVIKDSTIIGNSVTKGGPYNLGRGGGIEFAGSNLVLDRTTVANNTSPVQGGGIWLNNNTASANITNSTISGNKALEDAGGGMFINTPDASPVNITNSTLMNNFAGRDAGAIWTGGKNKKVKLTNTLLAKNSATVTKQGHTNFTLIEGGGNFVETIPGGRGPLVTAKSRYVSDLKLGALQLNGNDLVHPLLSGSPAINGGTTTNAPKVDQRNFLRDSRPDGGAFEISSTKATALATETVVLSSSSGAAAEPVSQTGSFGTPVQLDFSQGGATPLNSFSGSGEADTTRGSNRADRMMGKGGDDNLNGSGGNDQMIGGQGDDKLIGGRNHDLLRGQAGDDQLLGKAGSDILIGGAGNDTMTGGSGKDMFVFESLTDKIDTITDFNSAEDVIDLRPLFDETGVVGASNLDRFNQLVRLQQVGTDVEISIDADGAGAGTGAQLATLSNVSVDSLSPQNFVIAPVPA